ncbi:MAG: hypothetical protein AAF645_06325, partial [Myxococcota bacterium]
TGVEGLYMAGGSVHPGPGVAMVALSGRRAAERVYADLPSTQRSRQAARRGLRPSPERASRTPVAKSGWTLAGAA